VLAAGIVVILVSEPAGTARPHHKYRRFRADVIESDGEGHLLVLHRDIIGRIFNRNGVCQPDSGVVFNTEFTRDAASFLTNWAGVSPFPTARPICHGTFLFQRPEGSKKMACR